LSNALIHHFGIENGLCQKSIFQVISFISKNGKSVIQEKAKTSFGISHSIIEAK
jgi:hypothetical protein